MVKPVRIEWRSQVRALFASLSAVRTRLAPVLYADLSEETCSAALMAYLKEPNTLPTGSLQQNMKGPFL